jgi:serine/threonine-protein kinase RsbW
MTACHASLDCAAGISRQVADFVGELARRASLTDSEAYRLRIATDEIATNIAHYGYRDQGGTVDITGGFEGDRAWARLEDDSPPFDPSAHDPGPRLEAGPGGSQEGGFGLQVALTSVDYFCYEHIGGRNRNTLMVRRGTPDKDADETDGGHDDPQASADRR